MALLYLHGYRSSPESIKAVAVRDFCAAHDLAAPIIPHLPEHPMDAVACIDNIVASQTIDAIAGSSLGGFYAIYFAARLNLPCAVINPALTPWTALQGPAAQARYGWSDEEAQAAMDATEHFQAYATPAHQFPAHFTVLLGMQDEVIDPHATLATLAAAPHVRVWQVTQGNHALDDFGGRLAEWMAALHFG